MFPNIPHDFSCSSKQGRTDLEINWICESSIFPNLNTTFLLDCSSWRKFAYQRWFHLHRKRYDDFVEKFAGIYDVLQISADSTRSCVVSWEDYGITSRSFLALRFSGSRDGDENARSTIRVV